MVPKKQYNLKFKFYLSTFEKEHGKIVYWILIIFHM